MLKAITTASDTIKGLIGLSKFRRPQQDQLSSIGLFIENNAAAFPERVMLCTKNEELSWGAFNKRANQYAHALKADGVVLGESVAVLMENETEMLAAFVGICKLGAVAGLINTSLQKDQLVHCINTVGGTKTLFGSVSEGALSDVLVELESRDLGFIKCAETDLCPEWALSFTGSINAQPTENLPETIKIPSSAPAYYIFTSGTTGLPKAAIVTHWHWQLASSSFATILLRLKAKDRIYVCLPLFHTAAILIGFGATVFAGSSLYLAQKFSASNFWADVKLSKSTVFLYIGELCRYLLNSPVTEEEKNNLLSMCVGNGLRPEIWDAFKERFGINKVAEYYGSTEGNLAFMNIFNRNNTFGFALGKYRVAKYDVENGELVRTKTGFCTEVEENESGLLLPIISQKSPFKGYTDKSSTSEKILRNIFEDGDQFFNTGDIIKRVDVGPALGFKHFQFIDRIGDTFRWKGENVATGEVMELLNTIHGVESSCVYGVKVPHADGKAGMAALVINKDHFSLETFTETIVKNLTPPARPVFIRLLTAFDMTDTHKFKKNELQKEAFEVGLIADPIFVFDSIECCFLPLDFEAYRNVQSKKIRF